jgi:hypothetical protein
MASSRERIAPGQKGFRVIKQKGFRVIKMLDGSEGGHCCCCV